MIVLVNRGEMRRRLFARMGTSTSGLVMAESEDQANEALRAAAQHVEVLYAWPRTFVENTSLEIGVDQRFVTRPAGCRFGSIVELAVWDADDLQYYPLTRKRISVSRDTDPLNQVGGQDDEDTRDRPCYYEETGEQIELWPPADEVYPLKLVYRGDNDLNDDEDIPTVDSELIILWALADMLEFQGEDRLAAVQRQKFTSRYTQVRHWSHTAEVIKMGAAHRSEYQEGHISPNYDTRPSTI